MRFLRAYFYSQLLDLFGGVPIVVEAGSELDFPEQPLDPDHPPPYHSRRDVFEFVYEGLRRPDLIRYEFAHGGTPSGFGEFGGEIYAPTFTGPWFLKRSQDGRPTGPFRALFPIPEAPLDRNPNLRQNPGY